MPRQQSREPFRVRREGVAGEAILQPKHVELVGYLYQELAQDPSLTALMRIPDSYVEALKHVSAGLGLLK